MDGIETDPPAAAEHLEPLIRGQLPADTEAVGELLAVAFGRRAVAELSQDLLAEAHGGLSCALVAEVGSQVIGQVQLSRGWVDAPERLVEVAVLSPLGVLPAHQSRGVGALLVRSALRAAAELGTPVIFLEGSPTYYSRFGFAAAARLGFQRPSVRIPEAAFQAIRLAGWRPWMTGALVYPEAFWRWDSVGLRPDAVRPGS